MVRKQVLVQLDDEMVERLDDLAERLGVSRSELLRRGATAILEAGRLQQADRDLVAAYTERPQDPIVVEAARRLASEAAPEW